MKELELVRYILPSGILEYFQITEVEKEGEELHITLEEKNLPPEEYKGLKLKAHGFHQDASVRDFPLRGHPCYLRIKRRRWLLIDSNKVVSRDWDIVAQGTRITKEFADFLKGINR